MNSVRLAMDVHGGDYGEQVCMQGLLQALDRITQPLHIYLCGNREFIEPALASPEALRFAGQVTFTVEHCPQVTTSRDEPARIWKTKAGSSIVRCIALQQEGMVDVSFSAGDTRFLMAAGIFLLGRLKGVSRPALAAFIPTTRGGSVLLLDVGANLDCRSEQLASFGKMGYDYVRSLHRGTDPTVGLLNIGREPSKGTRTIRDADRLLRRECPGYLGYVEGNNIMTGGADVIVCDGFSGNLLLKASESFFSLALSFFADDRTTSDLIGQKMSRLNPELYGAVPLLGIHGNIFKAHGASTAPMIANAVSLTIRTTQQMLSEGSFESPRKDVPVHG